MAADRVWIWVRGLGWMVGFGEKKFGQWVGVESNG